MKRARAIPFLVAAGLAGAVIGWRGCGGSPGGGAVTGRLVGPIDSATVVLLIDPAAGVGAPATIAADGAFTATVPRGASEPFVVVDTKRGPMVRTRALHPAQGGDLGPLAVWETSVRVQRAGPRVRIDWGAIPQGTQGFPPRVRYSLLVSYARTDEAAGEAAFPTLQPAIESDLGELLGFLPHRDEHVLEVELEVRAFDPEDLHAPMWIGGRVRWRVDTNEVRPASSPSPALPD